MPDASATHVVHAYGMRSRVRVARLLDSLALIPCCPSVVFRVDHFGRQFAAVDALRSAKPTYFIRVVSWGGDSTAPVIEWTLDPAGFGRAIKRAADKALLNYTCGVRGKTPMEVKIDLRRHAEAYARTSGIAS